MTRCEIISAANLVDNGTLTKMLNELEWCGFIRRYNCIGKAVKEAVFQLIDNYTLFYFQFIAMNKQNDEHFWTISINSPMYHTWSGLAYERVCLQHIPAIKNALGISSVLTNVYSWRQRANEEKGVPGAQIDLLIDRNDQIVNLCEVKYSKAEYTICKEYESVLRQKVGLFAQVTDAKGHPPDNDYNVWLDR